MLRNNLPSILSFVALIALLSPAAWTQETDENGTVGSQGTVVLKRMPSSMRMTIQLSEKSKTLKEALANLKDRREAAVLMLKQLNANEASIVLSDPSISTTVSQQQRQLQQMILQRQRALGKRGGKANKIPSAVTVVCVVTADWPLKTDSIEQLLLTTKKIQDQVIAADLAGLNEPKELTPEEEELAEEAAELQGRYGYGEEEAQPGKPHFIYRARITHQQLKESLSAAFAKSKKQASDLAEAADAKLGSLAQISSVIGGEDYNENYGYAARAYMQQMMAMQAMTEDDGQKSENEAFSSKPGKVTFRFLVQAKFYLK